MTSPSQTPIVLLTCENGDMICQAFAAPISFQRIAIVFWSKLDEEQFTKAKYR